MTPDTILGWSLEIDGKRSHLVCESAVVVGTRSAIDGTVKFLLCGHTSETMHGVADEANQPMCSKCIASAFKLAKRDALPDMETRKPIREHDWQFYANGSFCRTCGASIGSGQACR